MDNQITYPEDNLPQYLSLAVTDGYPLFMDTKIRSMILMGIQELSGSGTDIYAYVIMPNHLHIIACHPELHKQIKSFKEKIAINIVLYLMNSNKTRMIQHLDEMTEESVAIKPMRLWETPEINTPIHNSNQMEKYIWMTHQNPVRSGIVRFADAWKWSSCKLTSGNLEPLNLETLQIPV